MTRADPRVLAETLAQCVAQPEDDAPRLVWADEIGGERGELVVLQCDLARGDLPPAEVALRRRRERELLSRAAEWSGIAHMVRQWRFHRGFVEAVRIDLADLVQHAEALFAAAPLLCALTIDGFAGRTNTVTRQIAEPRKAPETLGLLGRVLAMPVLRQLRALDLIEAAGFDQHGATVPLADDAVAMLAGYGTLEHLTALGITGGRLGSRGMQALGALAMHAPLTKLWLRGHALLPIDVAILLERFPAVTSIDLTGESLALDEIPPLLSRSLRSLAVSELTGAGLDALCASHAATTIEHLALLEVASPVDTAAFPSLRSLEWSGSELAVPGGRAVREIAILAPMSVDLGGLPLAELDALDLRRSFTIAVPTPVAGELLVEYSTPALLHPTARVALASEVRASANDLRGATLPEYFADFEHRSVIEIPNLAEVTIGQVAGNDIVIASVSLSHHHAILRWRAGLQHSIHDNASTSGIFVDGMLVDNMHLRDGTTLQLGGVMLQYFAGFGARLRAIAAAQEREHEKPRPI